MKKPNSVGYFSAYYRGLECLLAMWPKIREQVPNANLDVFYGWESWIKLEGENDFYHRMERKFAELKDQGVTVHGRVSHEELANAMQETQVWAYPTQFEEIFCITAVKANAAHCKPVVTDVAALTETSGPVATYIESARIYSDEYAQRKFVEATVKALQTPLTDDEIAKQDKFVEQFDWSTVAQSWAEAINA